MPSKTPKQTRLMRAAAHNPDIAKKAGVPQGVAREFAAADRKKAKAPKWSGHSRNRRSYMGA